MVLFAARLEFTNKKEDILIREAIFLEVLVNCDYVVDLPNIVIAKGARNQNCLFL